MSLEDEQLSLKSEIEALKAIYVNELEVKYDECATLTVHLHPSTADVETEKFVRLSLTLTISKEYPDLVPELKIENTRGLSDSDIERIYKDANLKAEESRGMPMLFEIIEVAKECLTKGNTPSCSCAICLYGFTAEDVFTKTECYHYFHSFCLATYMLHCKKEKEEEECKLEESQRNENPLQVFCPICRLFITFDNVLPQKFPQPEESGKAESFVLTDEMRETQCQIDAIFKKQQSKGGIIDVEAEKNKFLLEISQVPMVHLQLTSPVVPVSTKAEVGQEIQDSYSKNAKWTPNARNTRYFPEPRVKNINIRHAGSSFNPSAIEPGHKTFGQKSSDRFSAGGNYRNEKGVPQSKIEVVIEHSNDSTKDKTVAGSKADTLRKVTENVKDAEDGTQNAKRRFPKYRNRRTIMQDPRENTTCHEVRSNLLHDDCAITTIPGVKNLLTNESTTEITNHAEQKSENIIDIQEKRNFASKSSSRYNYKYGPTGSRRQDQKRASFENRNRRNSENNRSWESEMRNEEISHDCASTPNENRNAECANSDAEIKGKETKLVGSQHNRASFNSNYRYNGRRNWPSKKKYGNNYIFKESESIPGDALKSNPDIDRLTDSMNSRKTENDATANVADTHGILNPEDGQNDSVQLTENVECEKSNFSIDRNCHSNYNRASNRRRYNKQSGHESVILKRSEKDLNATSDILPCEEKGQYNNPSSHESNVLDSSGNQKNDYQEKKTAGSSDDNPLHHEKRPYNKASSRESDNLEKSQKNEQSNRNRLPNNPPQDKRQHAEQSSHDEGRLYNKQSSRESDSRERSQYPKDDYQRKNRNISHNIPLHDEEKQAIHDGEPQYNKQSNRESDSREISGNQNSNNRRSNRNRRPYIPRHDEGRQYTKQPSHDDERQYNKQSSRESDSVERSGNQRNDCPRSNTNIPRNIPYHEEEKQYTKQSIPDEKPQYTGSKQSNCENESLDISENQKSNYQRSNRNRRPNNNPRHDEGRQYSKQSSHDEERQENEQSSRQSVERGGNQKSNYQRNDRRKPLTSIPPRDEEPKYIKQSSHDEESHKKQSSHECDSLEKSRNQNDNYQRNNRNRRPNFPRHNEERPYTKQSSHDDERQYNKQSSHEGDSIERGGNQNNNYQRNNRNRRPNFPRYVEERPYTKQSNHDDERQYHKQSSCESDSIERGGNQNNNYQRNNKNRLHGEQRQYNKQSSCESEGLERSGNQKDDYQRKRSNRNKLLDKPVNEQYNQSEDITHFNHSSSKSSSNDTRTDNVDLVESGVPRNKGYYSKYKHNRRQYNQQSACEGDYLENSENGKKYQKNDGNNASDIQRHDEECGNCNSYSSEAATCVKTDNVQVDEGEFPLSNSKYKRKNSNRQRNNRTRKSSVNFSDTVHDQSKESIENTKCLNYGDGSSTIGPGNKNDGSPVNRSKSMGEPFNKTSRSVRVNTKDDSDCTFHKDAMAPPQKMQETKQIPEPASNSLQSDRNRLCSNQTCTSSAQEIRPETPTNPNNAKQTEHSKKHSASVNRKARASSENHSLSEMQHHDPTELHQSTTCTNKSEKGQKKVKGEFRPPGFPVRTVTNQPPPGFTVISVNDRPPPGFFQM